jgi:hypothetical protein
MNNNKKHGTGYSVSLLDHDIQKMVVIHHSQMTVHVGQKEKETR